MLHIYAYNPASESAKNLKAALGVKLISHKNSKYVGDEDKLVLNWGASQLPENVMKSMLINHPDAIAIASNKLTFFKHVSEHPEEVNIPEFTTDKDVARVWSEKGEVVVGRTKLQGSGGEDIVLFKDIGYFDTDHLHKNVKLYTRYIPKKDEYRVHVFDGKILDIRRKAVNPNYPAHMIDWKIRNHSKGFIFVKRDKPVNKMVYIQAMKAVAACGLDFGAVDVIWNEMRKKAYVLEINTAPGVEGSTIESYKEAIKTHYDEWKATPMKKIKKGNAFPLGGKPYIKIDFEQAAKHYEDFILYNPPAGQKPKKLFAEQEPNVEF